MIIRFIKNLFWITLGTGIGMVLALAGNTYLARILLPEGFGKIAYAQTWVQYLVLLADLGFTTYGIREVAKQKDKIKEFIVSIIPIRIIVATAIFSIFSLACLVFIHAQEIRSLMIGSALIIFVGALNVDWALQGLEKMSLSGLSCVLVNLIPLVLFLLFVRNESCLLRVPVLRFIGSIIPAIFILSILKTKINLRHFLNLAVFKYIKKARYFWFILLLVQVYNGSDIILMGIFRSQAEVGLYAAAFRLISALMAFLGLINTAVYPVLSDYSANDMPKFFRMKKIYLLTNLVIGGLVILCLYAWSPQIIIGLFGDNYRDSILPFQILALSVIIFLFNGPYAQSLLARGFEKEVFMVVVACALFNVITNLIFIPSYGSMAAAVSYVLSQLFGTLWVVGIYYGRLKKTAAASI